AAASRALQSTCPAGQELAQDFSSSPCACASTGVVNGVDTGRVGCAEHSEDGFFFCHTAAACADANAAPAFPGTAWRECDPDVDNEGAVMSCVSSPAACRELTLSGACSSTMFGEDTTTFVLYEGGCSGAAGGTAWHAPAEDVFMSYIVGGGGSSWIVSSGCGSPTGLIAYGSASPSLPFVDTDSSWTCATSTGAASTRALSITCSSYEGDELEVLPCVSGTFDESGEAPGGECAEACPEDRPTSPPGSTTAAACLPPPETCLEVSLVGSCSGTWSESHLWGTFVPFEGDCNDLSLNEDVGGRQSYFNKLTQYYLYFFSEYNGWFVSKNCGSPAGVTAIGFAGTFPFLSPATTWECAEIGFVSKPASIVCSRYASDPEACIEGTYEERHFDRGLLSAS
ncbi:hypothetical protein TeGR_g4647, partial [Tetraparma gracilis]